MMLWNATLICDGKNNGHPCINEVQTTVLWQVPMLVQGPQGPAIIGGTIPPQAKVPDGWTAHRPSKLSLDAAPKSGLLFCKTCSANLKAHAKRMESEG